MLCTRFGERYTILLLPDRNAWKLAGWATRQLLPDTDERPFRTPTLVEMKITIIEERRAVAEDDYRNFGPFLWTSSIALITRFF